MGGDSRRDREVRSALRELPQTQNGDADWSVSALVLTATRARVELATSTFVALRSIHLSYRASGAPFYRLSPLARPLRAPPAGGDPLNLSTDAFLLVLRVFVGLLMAGHGAQKAFALFGGGGMAQHEARVARMGFRPPRLWALASAYGELLGGAALAVGMLTPFAAAVVAVDMLVAILKVHLPNGLWITKGGSEYALTNLAIAVLFGLHGPGAYSIDAATGLVPWSLPLFLIAFGLGTIASFASVTTEAVTEEERHRPAA